MTEICRMRIGDWLKDYVDVKPGYSYSDEVVIRSGIAELINHDVFNSEELQKDILKECSVLLPLDYIKACAARG